MFPNVQSSAKSTTDLSQVRYYSVAIHVGFPSPSEDFLVEQLDLEAECHPSSWLRCPCMRLCLGLLRKVSSGRRHSSSSTVNTDQSP